MTAAPVRLASIDIGTNSVLLTVAEAGPTGLLPVVERATITRLGEGVDRTRALSEAAVERTLSCLAAYAEVLRAEGVARVEAVGTSAMRDAAGGATFVERAAELLGAAPRVISGEEEARLTFTGGLSGLTLDGDGAALVFDVGGGSTELILGRASPPHIESARSLDIGSVRLTERHVRSDPPSSQELRALDDDIAAALRGAVPTGTRALVGVAGTVTTMGAIARGIDPYDARSVHGLRLGADEVRAVARRLAALPLAERCALPGLSAKRADVIVAGARIVTAVLDASGAAALVVSDRGVRWGLLHRMAASA